METQQPSPELARARQALHEWADRAGMAEHDGVAALKGALRSSATAASLAGVDCLALLPEGRPSPSVWDLFMRFLAVARAVLVFLPILLTWEAIGHVASAARELGAESLLTVWIEGGGGLADRHLLPNLAMEYVYVLGGVVFLTVLIGFDRVRERDGGGTEERQAVAARIAIAAGAAAQQLQAERGAAATAQFSTQLAETAGKVSELASHLDTTLGGLDERLPRAMDLVATDLERIATSVAAARTSVDGAAHYLTESLSVLEGGTATRAEELATAVESLRDSVTAVEALTSSIPDGVSASMDASLTGFDDRMRGTGDALDEAATRLVARTGELDKLLLSHLTHVFEAATRGVPAGSS